MDGKIMENPEKHKNYVGLKHIFEEVLFKGKPVGYIDLLGIYHHYA